MLDDKSEVKVDYNNSLSKRFIKKLVFIGIPIILAIGILCAASYSYTGVINPISSIVAVITVHTTDTISFDAQTYPYKVYILKPYYLGDFIREMEAKGYNLISNDKDNNSVIFEKDGKIYDGYYDVSELFSSWRCKTN